MVLPFCIVVIALIIGTLVIPSIFLLIRSHTEFQPLLERARTIMDGTADPEPSEELDGKLYTWRFKKESHPSAAYTEVSPIKVTNIVSSDNNEVILTVSFHIIRYSANGEKESWIYYTNDKWYVRKDQVGDEAYEVFKHADLGDFFGVTGQIMKTDTGEVSIKALCPFPIGTKKSIILVETSLFSVSKVYFSFG